MVDLQSAQVAVREAGLDGWLFSNAFHRDEISDMILQVPRDGMNSRPWICVVFPDRPPEKIVHTIEAGILSHVPGRTTIYASRADFTGAITRVLGRGARVAAQFSSRFPVSSFFDHGSALLLEECGVRMVSSDDLIVSALGTIDAEGKRSIDRSCRILRAAVDEAWERLAAEVRRGAAVREADVQGWLASAIGAQGLDSGGPVLVAGRRGSADPHYMPQDGGQTLASGDVVQFDVWAKERSPGAIFGDISWAGVLGPEPGPKVQAVFDTVVAAREAALDFIRTRLASGMPVSGADVDRATREVIFARGFADGLRHRTGHSIGERIHGFGVNLDSVEFPDERRLREGSCFSVEPGIYLGEFGIRTEVDAYISEGKLVVCGGERQTRLLLVV
jgi:hypothetical protein